MDGSSVWNEIGFLLLVIEMMVVCQLSRLNFHFLTRRYLNILRQRKILYEEWFRDLRTMEG